MGRPLSISLIVLPRELLISLISLILNIISPSLLYFKIIIININILTEAFSFSAFKRLSDFNSLEIIIISLSNKNRFLNVKAIRGSKVKGFNLTSGFLI